MVFSAQTKRIVGAIAVRHDRDPRTAVLQRTPHLRKIHRRPHDRPSDPASPGASCVPRPAPPPPHAPRGPAGRSWADSPRAHDSAEALPASRLADRNGKSPTRSLSDRQRTAQHSKLFHLKFGAVAPAANCSPTGHGTLGDCRWRLNEPPLLGTGPGGCGSARP